MRKGVAIGCVIFLLGFTTLSFGQMNTIKIDNLYSMEIPKVMTFDSSLNDEASLQYSNFDLEIYVLVIHESKSEFIEVSKEFDLYDQSIPVIDCFANAQLDSFGEYAEVFDLTELVKKRSQGMPIRTIVMDANIAGITIPITYFFGFVEGKSTLYTVMAWTLYESKGEFKREAEKMIHSLKEL